MKNSLKEWAEAGLEAGIILLVLFLFCWPVKIEGSSMESTFYNGDRVMISRALKIANAYEPGDILVISAKVYGGKTNIIKRMIAEEGDHVQIEQGNVFVNDIELFEPYVQGETWGKIDMIVPEGCIFVLGDNREHSLDSRELGAVKKDKISGKVILKWYPMKDRKFY